MRAKLSQFRLRRVVVCRRIQRLRGELLLQLAESEVLAELDQKLHHFVRRLGHIDACELFMRLVHRQFLQHALDGQQNTLVLVESPPIL